MKIFLRKKEDQSQIIPTKWGFWGGYIVSGIIFAVAHNVYKLNKSTLGDLVILVVAIGAGFLYYPLKSKIKIKDETTKAIIAFVIIFIVAGFLCGFLTSLANNWKTIALNTPFGTQITKEDGDSLTQLNKNQEAYLVDFQKRWDEAQKNIDEGDTSPYNCHRNILAYLELQKLNNENYSRFVDYTNQTNPIIIKYSQNLVDALLQLIKVREKYRDSYNEIILAKIDYFQAISDSKMGVNTYSENEIEAKGLIVNNAIDKVSQLEQEMTQAQNNWQKVYTEFFGS